METTPVARFEELEDLSEEGADHRARWAAWHPLASAVERSRLTALRQPEDRVAFVAAHLLVRQVAARLLGCDLGDVEVAQQCPGCGAAGHGRPFVRGAEVALSLSHATWRDETGRPSAAVAALAVAGRMPVGIDVERRWARVPAAALTPDEQAAVRAGLDPTVLWCRKEAGVKAGVTTLDRLAALDVLEQVTRAPDHSPRSGTRVRFTDWKGASALGSWAQWVV